MLIVMSSGLVWIEYRQCLNRNISSWQEANKQQHRNTEDYILMRLTDDNKQRGQFNGLCSRKHVLPPDEA